MVAWAPAQRVNAKVQGRSVLRRNVQLAHRRAVVGHIAFPFRLVWFGACGVRQGAMLGGRSVPGETRRADCAPQMLLLGDPQVFGDATAESHGQRARQK